MAAQPLSDEDERKCADLSQPRQAVAILASALPAVAEVSPRRAAHRSIRTSRWKVILNIIVGAITDVPITGGLTMADLTIITTALALLPAWRASQPVL